jgi:BirA family biotin operon repressor/biotin-[acetyl-CoA-carboxylase] ligase
MNTETHNDAIDLQKVQEQLVSSTVGQRIIYLDTVPSTMDVAHLYGKEPNSNGLVVLAEEQTAGRGRFSRSWVSPKYQNLYASVLLQSTEPTLKYMSIATSLAVSKALEKVTSLHPQVKWPNDLTINGKKIGGILVEQVYSAGEQSYGIIGIGLNINMDPADYSEIAESATSIRAESGRIFSRELILTAILESLDIEYQRVQVGFSPIKEWKDRLVTLNKKITVRDSYRVHTGEAVDVDDNGNLVMRLDDDSYITLHSGDVTSHVPWPDSTP